MVEMERLKPLESINWLARNKHGRLCGYDRLPTKSEDRWLPKEGHSFVIMPSTPKHDYIQWKDEHPTYISTLTILPAKEDKTEVHREASQGGLTLVDYDKIIAILKKYLATPVKDCEVPPIYYVKLPSGHYMVTLQDGTIGWRSDIQLAQAYTKHELKELNELYWTLAIPAFPDFLKNNKED